MRNVTKMLLMLMLFLASTFVLVPQAGAQAPYCTPTYSTGCTVGDGLTSFQLGSINQTIACNGSPYTWYHDYTSVSTLMLINNPTTLTVVAGYSSTYVRVWIDFNNNNLFETSEIVVSSLVCSSSGVAYSTTITIPTGTPTGNHRLRFRTNWLSVPTDPCASYSYGNSADFTIIIPPPPPPSAVTIGTGTASCNWPYTTYWGDGRTQILLTAAEITAAGGAPGNISKLAFNVITANPQVMNGFTIEAQHTALTTLTGFVLTPGTVVYTANYTVPGTGWQTITFTTPFNWNGTSNVLFNICYDNGYNYNNYSPVYGTAGTTMCWNFYTDGSPGCAMTTGSGKARPNVQMTMNIIAGHISGVITSCFNGLPLSGATVSIGSNSTITAADGSYLLLNVPIGQQQLSVTKLGYQSGSFPVTIIANQLITFNGCINPLPANITGVVRNAADGTPIIGAKVWIDNFVTYSTTDGNYFLTVMPGGTYTLYCGKPGWDQFSTTQAFIGGTTTLPINLNQTTYAPGPFTATLNTGQTAVNLVWAPPSGLYEVIYDDGIEDDFTVWANQGNMNAVKFTPLNYPATLMAGRVDIGVEGDYPAGAEPLVPFQIAVYDATGSGGSPGTQIGDPIDVVPTAYGWVEFTFPTPINITSGNFYLVMIQGGNAPNAAGLAIDLTAPKLRSWSKFVTGGGPWLPAAGNYMMRAVLNGIGGPLLLDNLGGDKIFTANAIEGMLYKTVPASVTGKEGVGIYAGVNWADYADAANAPAPQTVNRNVQYIAQPASDQSATEGQPFTMINPLPVPENTAAILYNNGPFMNSPGTGFGGADESVIVTGTNSYGFNDNNTPYRITDDFTVGAEGSWGLTSIEFFGYQTGSTTTSTFTQAFIRIWNGMPGAAGSAVVWGDTTTNRLASTSWTNCYRVSVPGGVETTRPLMKIVANTSGLVLSPGNYWVEFGAKGTLASGPWCPPISINGQPNCGNALQFVGTTNGYVAITSGASLYPQGVPFIINGSVIVPGALPYQVWRLKQGEEGNQSVWTSVYTGNSTYTTDNNWQTLPNGAYRWAVKAKYPGDRWSQPTFSNVLGKNWTAGVTINVTLTCANNTTEFTIVKLQNIAYPDTVYQTTLDATGTVTYPTVWKGDYSLTVTKFGYDLYAQNYTIMAPMTIDVMLLEKKPAPYGMTVNDQSLVCKWRPPKGQENFFFENWNSGSFATNGWVADAGNWAVYMYLGNPAPAAWFYYYPSATNYEQSITSKTIQGAHSEIMLVGWDIYLSNYYAGIPNYLSVEIWNGTAWNELKTYQNTGNISWTSEVVDASAYTHDAFKIRFRAWGDDSYYINYWVVDNIFVAAAFNPQTCLLGYNFYLDNTLIAVTSDTTYTIPPQLVAYGQNYTACALGVYGSGYSGTTCAPFTSHFLCPTTGLTGQAIENTAYLTWTKPSCSGGEMMSFIFDDGVAENGWCINPGYLAWLGNVFPIDPALNGQLKSFDVWFGSWGMGGTSQPLTIDVFDPAYNLLGSTGVFAQTDQVWVNVEAPDIPFDGPFLGMVKWNFVPGTSMFMGFDENGPYSADALGWYSDGSTWAPINQIAGGNPGVFLCRANALVFGDKSDKMVTLGPTIQPKGNPAPTNALAKATGQIDTKSHPPTGVNPIGSSPDADSGLRGYMIYRNGTALGPPPPPPMINDPNILEYYDVGLDPQCFLYGVTGVYDLSVFGFIGQWGQSLPDTATVCINYGRPLPFYEPWDMGSFAYNDWTFNPDQSNWSINTGFGNPAPSADFSWQPALTGYSSALESPTLNAGPWTCAKIYLDYDYKLIDRNSTANEKLTVEVLIDGTWKKVIEYTNEGSVDWTFATNEISSAKGKAFKVRFRAHGDNSVDLLHWYFDNIHVYGICAVPQTLDATVIGTPANDVQLTWSPPFCGTTGTVVSFIFDDGEAENGWCINPGYLAWLGNVFPIDPAFNGVLQSFDVWFGSWGMGGTSQPLTIDVFDPAYNLIGSTGVFAQTDQLWVNVEAPDIPFDGPFLGMVKWDNVPGTSMFMGFDENGPYSADALGWYSDGSTWAPINQIAGGNPGVFLLRANALVFGDKSDNMVTLGPTIQPKGTPAPTNALTKATGRIDTKNHRPMGVTFLTGNSDVDVSYDIYRMSDSAPDWAKINTAPVTDTFYTDLNLPSDIYYYTVTAVYGTTCTSDSSNIVEADVVVGIDPVNSGTISIYPNPATENVNVKSDYMISEIEVLNYVGQMVYNKKDVETKVAKINVSSFQSGVYFVKVTTDQGVRTVKITVAR